MYAQRLRQKRATLKAEVRDMGYITRTLLSGMLALALPGLLLAQRGFSTGGHMAGTARGIGTAGGHGFAAPPVGTARRGVRSPIFPGYTGIRPGALNSHGARGRDFRRVPYGYFFAPYYYPFLDYANSAYPDYAPGPGAAADPDC